MPSKKIRTPLKSTTGTRYSRSEELISFQVKKHHIYAALIPVAFIIGLAMGYYIYGRAAYLASASYRSMPEQTAAPTNVESALATGVPATIASAEQRVDIPIDASDPILGSADAPVTIIEFEDFQCPYCQRHTVRTFPQLSAQYGDKIRFVFKDFPLTGIHPQALPAALAAECAREQGKFWEYHDLLFSGRRELGDETYQAYAVELDLNSEQFTSCYAEARYSDAIQADFNLGVQNGVNGTPTFFVNGIRLVGAQPFSVFANLIDAELAVQGN